MANQRLMICAGEASGDWLAGQLVSALNQQNPILHCFGMGGKHARTAGMTTYLDIDHLPGMGLWELIAHLPTFHHHYTECARLLRTLSPDALVLIDYPGFNLRLAQVAHRMGIPVLYYVSPKIWAWGGDRIHKIKQCVDHMAVVFPFEVPLYEKVGMKVSDVGHPLCQSLTPRPKPFAKQAEMSITLMPGSRPHEIERMLPVFLESAKMWLKKHPKTHFLLPKAPNLSDKTWLPYQALDLPITYLDGDAQRALASSDLAWITSGTASLEAALIGTPHVVCYQVGVVTAWYFKNKLKVPYISLPNLILEQEWIPELLQKAVNPNNILKASEQLLTAQGQHINQANTKALWQALGGNKASLVDLVQAIMKQ